LKGHRRRGKTLRDGKERKAEEGKNEGRDGENIPLKKFMVTALCRNSRK